MTTESIALLEQARQGFAEGDVQRAQSLCQQAVTLDPQNADCHNLLGLIAARQGDSAQAAIHFSTAVEYMPSSPVIHNNLGAACFELGDLERARTAFTDAVRCFPGYAVAHKNLGQVHQQLGDVSAAVECFQAALLQNPKFAPAHIAWADMLSERGDLLAAARHYQQALELQDTHDIRVRLASTLHGMGHHQRAVTLYREVAATDPHYPGLQNNLGQTLFQLGQVQEAIDCLLVATREEGVGPIPANSLGNVYTKLGRPAEAISCFRQSLAIDPDYATAHSNLLLNMNYVGTAQSEVFAEAKSFATRQFGALLENLQALPNEPVTDRQLRIGYVSGDFRSHSVAYYLLPLLEAHDRDRFEIYCYANNPREDAMTDQFRTLADHWVPIRGIADAAVADRIRADRIDILVDLAGHTAGNRLGVFARKPAPVQISWLGYPNTTGLNTIDYRLTDAVADPVHDAIDVHYAEALFRLPECFLCYCADARSSAVAPPPFAENGYTTFGSFNMLAKVTPEVVAVWAQILMAVPDSRLLMKGQSLDHQSSQAAMRNQFAEHGISPERLELMGMVSKEAHYEVYAKVDIALDTFPYNGTTTTCEALWMGVPVITLQGDVHAGRVGASLLRQAGLAEFIAADQEAYIALAKAVGNDHERCQVLRSGLRTQLQASALMDKQRFAGQMEQAYRSMWLQWCKQH